MSSRSGSYLCAATPPVTAPPPATLVVPAARPQLLKLLVRLGADLAHVGVLLVELEAVLPTPASCPAANTQPTLTPQREIGGSAIT